MVDGTPVHSMTTDVAVLLAAWAVVCLGITIRFFRWTRFRQRQQFSRLRAR